MLLECGKRVGVDSAGNDRALSQGAARDYDLLIKNGRVIDGTGSPAFNADVGIRNGKIAEIGKLRGSAKRTIDAKGQVVAPGFIDSHTHFDAQVTWDPLHPYLRQVYDAFCPRRMFWGSDLTRLSCPYRQVVTMFTEEISWLTSEDKEWIMGRALCAWSGWE